MKKIGYLLVLLLPILLVGCPNNDGDTYHGIWIENNSAQKITTYIAYDQLYGHVYPDTTISLNFWSVDINPNASFKYTFSIFRQIDTLSFFIFSTDTIAKYGWEQVKDDYMVLKRLDLSWEDIKEVKWMVSYP